MGSARSSHSWLQGSGCSKACVSLPVGGTGSRGSWLRGLKWLKAGVGLLVGRPGPRESWGWCQPASEWAGSCHRKLRGCSGLGAGHECRTLQVFQPKISSLSIHWCLQNSQKWHLWHIPPRQENVFLYCLMQSILEEANFLGTLSTLGVTWEQMNDQEVGIFYGQCAITNSDGFHCGDAAFCP